MMKSGLVPHAMHGWRVEDAVKTYDRDTIFEYIDGAGEVYRLYAFQELDVYRFTKAGEPDIALEIFDMGTSEDAFGVFTHGREGEEAGVGQGSEYRGGLLCFWKSKFFVCVYAEGESDIAQTAVLDLGRAIADSIQTIGSKPEILDYLPEEGLVEESVRFFHTHISLNYHYFLADSNILNLDEETDAILAKYDQPGGRSLLLLVKYRYEEQAQMAFDSFVDAYIPEAYQTHIVQTEDGSWVAAKSIENIIAIVFDAPSERQAESLLESVRATE